MQMTAMSDELLKIAACKARSYSTPIRAENLASRSRVDKTSGQLKTAAPSLQAAKSLVGGKAGKVGLTAAGSIAAWETGKQALRDYQLGRAIRKQQSQRG